MASYVLAWFLYAYIADIVTDIWTFLSNWTEGVMVVYFVFAFTISIYAICTRHNKAATDENTGTRKFYVDNFQFRLEFLGTS